MSDQRSELLRRLEEGVEAYAVRIAPVYSLLNWCWDTRADPIAPTEHKALCVPDAARIAASLRRSIKSMIEGDHNASDTGGLRVWIDPEEGGYGIEFVDSWQDYQ